MARVSLMISTSARGGAGGSRGGTGGEGGDNGGGGGSVGGAASVGGPGSVGGSGSAGGAGCVAEGDNGSTSDGSPATCADCVGLSWSCDVTVTSSATLPVAPPPCALLIVAGWNTGSGAGAPWRA